jgi:hypothetical protein
MFFLYRWKTMTRHLILNIFYQPHVFDKIFLNNRVFNIGN